MASSSLSESIHASIIVQQQLQDAEKKNRQSLGAPDSSLSRRECRFQESGAHDDTGLNWCLQLLLVSCFIGVELIACFDQIFEVLFLQFFGVPMELVTICGVISGSLSIALLPILGWFSNTGSNLLTRKLMTMFFILFKIVGGFVGLIVCGFLKMRSLKNIPRTDLPSTNDLKFNGTITVAQREWETNNLSNYRSLLDTFEVSSSTMPSILNSEVFSTSTTRIVLGICAFSIIDVGMDIGMLFCRTFVLECVPSVQHTRILTLASTVQSLSGMIFSLFNTLDISGFLGDLFGVDGTASLFLFLSGLVSLILISGFSCSMLTGYLVVKQRHKSHLPVDIKSRPILKHSSVSNNRTIPKQMASQLTKKPDSNDARNTKPPATDTNEFRLPLINENTTGTKNYSTISEDYRMGHSNEINVIGGEIKGSDLETSDHVTLLGSNTNELSDQRLIHHSIPYNSEGEMNSLEESVSSECGSNLEATPDQTPTTFMDVLKASYSMSLSIVERTPNKDIHASRANANNNLMLPKKEKSRKNSFYSKRLLILVLSSFLANGAMTTVTVYSANALTVGIYQGDPRALPGTDGNLRYRKGLRQAAWGNVAMYVSYAVTCLFTKKIVDVIGESLQYTMSHVIFLASAVSLILVKSEEVYFLLMFVAGIYRVCVYTLTYIMGTKFASEQAGDRESASKNVVKVVALVGVNLPLHYVTMSTFMGPLMAATGSPWVSIQYAIATTSGSLLIFLLMYAVK